MAAAPVKAPAMAAVEAGDAEKASESSPAVAAASMMPAENPSTMSFHRWGSAFTARPQSTPMMEEHPTERRTMVKIFISGILPYLRHPGAKIPSAVDGHLCYLVDYQKCSDS